MINELSTAAASLLLFFGSSQSSDEKVAPVKADSAFQCSQINQAAGSNQYSAVNEMIELSLRQLDKAYTGDSTIEQFYQVRLRGEIQPYSISGDNNLDWIVSKEIGGLQRYKEMYSQKIVDTCIEKPSLGILEAATNALNKTYQLTTTTPFYALCNAYNKDTINYHSLISLALDSTVSNALSVVTAVQRDPAYGDAHLESMISQQCTLNPMQPALEAMFTSAHETYYAAKAEANKQFLAREEARRAAEQQELDRYHQEQERLKTKLKAEQENKLKTTSLYSGPDSTAVCRDVSKQVSLSSDSRVALLKTFEDGIIRLNFEPSRQQLFLSSLQNDSLNIISDAKDSCDRNPTSSLESVLGVILPNISISKKDSPTHESVVDTPNESPAINNRVDHTNNRKQKNKGNQLATPIVQEEQLLIPEWSSSFAQGTMEYHVDDGNGNSLLISCPGGQLRPASAKVTTQGFGYYSPKNTQQQGMIEMSFIIDGVQFDDPFKTGCNACEDSFINAFWPTLLKANNLYVHADGYEVRFTTQGLRDVLSPLDDPGNMCLTDSQAFALANEPFRPTQAAAPNLPAGFTHRAVIDDPDGYSNIRSQKNAKSQVVGQITQGEQFFTYMQDGNWWRVRTQQGKIGYMHVSRIRLLD